MGFRCSPKCYYAKSISLFYVTWAFSGDPSTITQEPGLYEGGKRRCDNANDCRQGEFCHKLISFSGVCAPKGRACSSTQACPNIGNKFEGQVFGICGARGICEWEL